MTRKEVEVLPDLLFRATILRVIFHGWAIVLAEDDVEEFFESDDSKRLTVQ